MPFVASRTGGGGEGGGPVVLEERVPVAPGTSPFRVKGHVYAKMRKNVDETLPGGVAALVERIDDPEVAAFFQQPFLSASWYDALPMMPVSLTHARLVGVPLHQFCRDKGRTVASEDVPGIYRAMLRLASPGMLAGRLPRAATLYFDFGRGSVEWLADNVARTKLDGVPSTIAGMLAGVIEGFAAKALELTGAPGVQVRTLEVVYDGGVVGGVRTASLRHEHTWRK